MLVVSFAVKILNTNASQLDLNVVSFGVRFNILTCEVNLCSTE